MNNFPTFLTLLLPFIIVELVLKALALWRAARAGQTGWFVALLILNSVGLLPLIYLVFFAPKQTVKSASKK